jgi:hypothetical protein
VDPHTPSLCTSPLHATYLMLRMAPAMQVIFTSEELKAIKAVKEPGLHVLGFKPLCCLQPHHQLATGDFVYPSERQLKGSCAAFMALHGVMLGEQQMAVTCYVRTQASMPRLVALVAQEQVLDEYDTQVGGGRRCSNCGCGVDDLCPEQHHAECEAAACQEAQCDAFGPSLIAAVHVPGVMPASMLHHRHALVRPLNTSLLLTQVSLALRAPLQLMPEGLLLLPLPFSDDLRYPEAGAKVLPPIANSEQATQQLQAAEALVEALTLDDSWDSSVCNNPVIARHFDVSLPCCLLCGR